MRLCFIAKRNYEYRKGCQHKFKIRGAQGMKRAYKVFWVSLFIISLTISIQEALAQSEDIAGEKQEEEKPQNPTLRTIKYKVRVGDTLYSVAKKFRVSVDELKKLNGLKDDNLEVDQVIRVPYDFKRSKTLSTRGDETSTSTSKKQETEATTLEGDNKEIGAPTNDLETKEPEAQTTAQEKLQEEEKVIEKKEVKAPEESPKQES